ncbi:MAG: flagellar protein FliS [Erythrobacter sp.]|uniref:flagellar protein FliS n=1 Tax=Erythrobacter sp. TaxID=1042 RepID=UPI002600B7DB|nr:flagellar protein FliS [Erythrobacter sp.]MCL9998836.1 flagellar protein FliS [Erythrobacter sp.]
MQMLSRNPAAAYRRVALDARIEASGSADLTRICLEEAMVALGQALVAIERGSSPGREPLVRAQTILLWLAKSVAPEHPLGASLKAFYGGLAGQVGAQILQADAQAIAEIRKDISDVLEAAG